MAAGQKRDMRGVNLSDLSLNGTVIRVACSAVY